MSATIHVSVEARRGCGFRSSGWGGVGIYLMGEGRREVCERLPFPLHVCPTCGEGMPVRQGWGWVAPRKLFGADREPLCLADVNPDHRHDVCWLCSPGAERAGLIWIGAGFYPTPADFQAEALRMGVSRKLPAIPRGFVPGETVVYLAHRAAVTGTDAEGRPTATPGVFTAFRPVRVDLVVDVDDPADLPPRALQLARRLGDAARVVRVVRDDGQARAL